MSYLHLSSSISFPLNSTKLKSEAEVFCKEGALRVFVKFPEKHMCQTTQK